MAHLGDIGHHVLDVLLDLAAAYLAHHFAPRFPKPNFFTRYVGWAVIVLCALPLQFIVYESYVGERPIYVNAIALAISAVVALGWLSYQISVANFPSSLVPGTFIQRYPRFKRRARILSVSCALFYASFGAWWLWYQELAPPGLVIVVARFHGPRPDVYSPTDSIIAGLRDADQKAEIVAGGVEVTAEGGPLQAASLGTPLIGERHRATAVLWGWYKMSDSGAEVNARIEPLAFRNEAQIKRGAFQSFEPTNLASVTHLRVTPPIDELKRFSFQPKFAEEIKTRAFYILGITELISRSPERAIPFLEQANSVQATMTVPRRALADIAHRRDGTLFDYVLSQGAFISANIPATFAPVVRGNPDALVALGFADLDVAASDAAGGEYQDVLQLTSDAMESCSAAGLLQPMNPSAFSCLGFVHSLTAVLKTNAGKEEVHPAESARLGFDDCNRAVVLAPNNSTFHACRGEAAFLLGRITGMDSGEKRFPTARDWYAQALEDWNQVIAANAGDADALERRGEAKGRLQDYAGAEADFTSSLHLARSAYGLNNRGRIKAIRGDLRGALADYEAAADLSPSEDAIWCNVALAARQLDRYEQARAAAIKCKSLARTPEMSEFADEELQLLKTTQ